jgi:hypothetical protein
VCVKLSPTILSLGLPFKISIISSILPYSCCVYTIFRIFLAVFIVSDDTWICSLCLNLKFILVCSTNIFRFGYFKFIYIILLLCIKFLPHYIYISHLLRCILLLYCCFNIFISLLCSLFFNLFGFPPPSCFRNNTFFWGGGRKPTPSLQPVGPGTKLRLASNL